MFDPNQMRRSTEPLSTTQFTQYILVPHVASKLIKEDLACNDKQAYEAMVKSADVGASLYPADDDDDDLELEKIIRANIRAAKPKNRFMFEDENEEADYELVVVDNPSSSTSNPVGAKPSRPKPRQVKMVRVTDKVRSSESFVVIRVSDACCVHLECIAGCQVHQITEKTC
jgi:hypothetical protein